MSWHQSEELMGIRLTGWTTGAGSNLHRHVETINHAEVVEVMSVPAIEAELRQRHSFSIKTVLKQ